MGQNTKKGRITLWCNDYHHASSLIRQKQAVLESGCAVVRLFDSSLALRGQTFIVGGWIDRLLALAVMRCGSTVGARGTNACLCGQMTAPCIPRTVIPIVP